MLTINNAIHKVYLKDGPEKTCSVCGVTARNVTGRAAWLTETYAGGYPSYDGLARLKGTDGEDGSSDEEYFDDGPARSACGGEYSCVIPLCPKCGNPENIRAPLRRGLRFV
jgi:hypothetical protein